MLFVEAPTSEAEIAAIAKSVSGWKLINMFEGGKTPLLPVARLEALGYHLVIIPSDTQRAAIKAMQRVLAAIAPRRQRRLDARRHGLVQGTRGAGRYRGLSRSQQPLCVLAAGPTCWRKRPPPLTLPIACNVE